MAIKPYTPGGKGGGRIGSGGQSAAQLELAMQQADAYRILSEQFPVLGEQAGVLTSLASDSGSVDEAVNNAIAAVGNVGLNQMIDDFKGMNAKDQRGQWELMPQGKRSAFERMGYTVPGEAGGGLWDTAKDVLGKARGLPLVGGAMGAVAFPVKTSLKAMDEMSQFMGRFPRAGESRRDQEMERRRLKDLGIDPDALSERTGIRLGGGKINPIAHSLANPIEGMFTSDYWKIWNSQGQDGEDDILSSRQVEAFDILDRADTNTAVEDLSRARMLAQGMTFQDIAQAEGLDPLDPRYQQWASDLQVKWTTDGPFKDAFNKMANGKMSYGRMTARTMGFSDADMKDKSHPAFWVSGAADAAYAVLVDPTIIGGKFAKGAKLARLGVESAEGIERFRGLWRVAKLADEGASRAEIAAKLGSEPRNIFAVRHLSRETDLVSLGRKVGAPAERIAEAFKTKDWSGLGRDLPTAIPGLDGMIAYHESQLAKGLTGMTDPEVVFDFYTHSAFMNETGRSAKESARGLALFGKDPNHLYIPTTGGVASKLKDTKWYRTLALDGAKDLPNGVSTDIAAALDEDGEFVARGLGDYNVALDKLGNWQKVERGKLTGFVHAFTQEAPRTRGYLRLNDEVTEGALSEMGKFFNAFGVFGGMPRETIDSYMNLAVSGNQAQRTLVINAFMKDLFSKAGILEDIKGKAWAQNFMNHNAQAFGVTDHVALANGVLSKDAVFSRQLASALSVPTLKDFLVATRKVNALRRVSGAVNSGMIDAVMSRAWKPMQLMRMGFAARAGGEEALSFILRNSAHDYFRTKVALPWALSGEKHALVPGIELVAKDSAQSSLMRPIKILSEGMLRMAGLSPDALEDYGVRKAMASLEWGTATLGRKHEMVKEFGEAYRTSNRAKLALQHLDNAANLVSLASSKFFHEVAQTAGVWDRARIGEWALGKERAALVDAGAMFVDSPYGEQLLSEGVASSVVRGDATQHSTRPERNVLTTDPRSPHEQIMLPLQSTGEWHWVTMQDPAAFMHGAAIQLDHMAESVGGREAARELNNHFNSDELREINRKVSSEGQSYAWWRSNDPDMAAMDSLLDDPDWNVRSHAADVYEEALDEQSRQGLTDLYGIRRKIKEASEEDKATLRVIVREGQVDLAPSLQDPDIRKLVGQFMDDPDLKHVIDPDKKGRIHLSREEAWRAAENRVYNALRRLDSQDFSRRAVRAMTIDGKVVADAMRPNTRHLFMPMFDRQTAPGVTALLSSAEGVEAYAQHLSANLGELGFGKDFVDAYMATPPSTSGWSVADYMGGIQAQTGMDGGMYIPTALTASPNRQVAEAVRDAISQTLDDLGQNTGALKPTVGKLVISPDEVGQSVLKGDGDNIYHVAPHKALKAEAMDPDDIHEMVMVQFEEGHTLTMTRAELNRQLGESNRLLTRDQRKAGWAGELSQGGLYKEIHTWEANGLSEDTALRRAAQDASFDIMHMLYGKKSGKPMRDLIDEMVHGELDGHGVWSKVDAGELPERLYAPRLATPENGKFERVVGGMTNAFFDRYASPMIRSLSHSPQYMWNVSKASKQMRFVFDNLASDDLAQEAHLLLSHVGIEPEEFKAFNRHYVGRPSPLEAGADEAKDKWLGLASLVDADQFNPGGMREQLQLMFPESQVSTLDDGSMQALRNWSKNQNAAWQEWRDASLLRGYNLTIPFIDNSQIRSQFQEYIGPILPFWYAEEQFLKRMARGVAQTPWMLRKAQLGMNGLTNMGIVRTDDQGNRMFVYPGSEAVMGTIGAAAGLVFGDAARQVLSNPLTSNVDYMVPGYNTDQIGRMSFGPIVGIPLNQLATRYPEWGKVQDALYGEDRAAMSGSTMAQLMPASMMKLYKAAFADDSDSQLASATLQSMQLMESTGHGLSETANEVERERYYSDVRSGGRVIMATRGLTGFFGFASASPDMDRNRFSEKFQALLDTGMNYQTALDTFIEVNGPEALPYTVFKSESDGPISSTDSAYNWMIENDGYLKQYKLAAPWVIPQAASRDKFNQRAYNEAMAMKLRHIRSPEEWETAFYKAQAGPQYWEKRDEVKARLWELKQRKERMPSSVYTEEKATIDDEWTSYSHSYRQQHPVWAATLTSKGADDRKQTVQQLRTMLADPSAPDQERLKPMRELIEEYDKFERKRSSLANQSSKRARDLRDDISEDFFGWAYLHVANHPELQTVWTSIIRPGLPDANELESDLMKQGT